MSQQRITRPRITRPRISQDKRVEIVALLEKGRTCQEISDIVKVARSSVSFIGRRWKEERSIRVGRSTGRPEKYSERDKRHLLRLAKEMKGATLRSITSNIPMSMWKAREILREHEMRGEEWEYKNPSPSRTAARRKRANKHAGQKVRQ